MAAGLFARGARPAGHDLPSIPLLCHGATDTDSIGWSSSHGCIRLSNQDITTLAKLLPLGTPVNIS